MNERKRERTRLRQGKRERYLQPSLLMGLLFKQSYGYELIQSIQEFGFVEGEPPPGMVYRHLRQLEGDGLVTSEWETEGSGPAKRTYRLTAEGVEVLDTLDRTHGKAGSDTRQVHRGLSKHLKKEKIIPYLS